MAEQTNCYNAKMVDYGNGVIQFRLYDKPIFTGYSRELNDSNIDIPCMEDIEMLEDIKDNPFLDDIDYNELKVQEEKRRKEYNQFRSLDVSSKRSKEMVYQYSMSNEWEWFLTFTFDPQKVDSYNYDECLQKLRKWFNNVRVRKSENIMYLCVPEQHKSGRWHFHALVSNIGSLKFADSGHTDSKGNVIYNVSDYKWGFTTATPVKDTKRVSSYLVKYITKDLCSHTTGKRRYIQSKNLKLPVITSGIVPKDYAVELLKDVGNIVLYTKTMEMYGAENTVRYITVDVSQNLPELEH